MKEIVWIAGATLSGAILFGAGLLVGRQFPAHHYQELGNTSRLFDSTTGHVCSTTPSIKSVGGISVIPWNSPEQPTSAPEDLGLPPCNSK